MVGVSGKVVLALCSSFTSTTLRAFHNARVPDEWSNQSTPTLFMKNEERLKYCFFPCFTRMGNLHSSGAGLAFLRAHGFVPIKGSSKVNNRLKNLTVERPYSQCTYITLPFLMPLHL